MTTVIMRAGLGGRMFVFAAGAVLAVLATVILFALLWGDRTAERRAAEETRVAQRLWESLMEEEAVVMERATADPLLVAAMDRNNGQAAAARLPLLGFSAAALVNSVGQPLMSVSGQADMRPTDMHVIDERRVAQVLAQNDAYTGLVVVGGAVQHMLAAPFGETRPADRAVVALRTVQPSLMVLARVLGGSAYLVDDNGALYDRAGALPWEDIQPSLANGGADYAKVHRAGRSFEVRTLRLADPAGGNTLSLVVARESTLEDMATSLFDTSAILVLMTVLAASLFGLEWYFRRSLAPIHASLSALSALADGDTNVAVLGAERSDEAGRLARTVEVFRNRSRALQDAEARRGRHWLRQQSFIRKQMLRMAETLPDQGRVELLGDLDRIESVTDRGGEAGGLAVAFEVMAERVRSQHAALDGMVVQLRASLDTKTELVELQKQFEIARRMQEAILPAGLPARPDLAAAGLLLPAAEFDGSFYDFFLADDDTLVVLLGQVSGGGLAAGFMTVTARTAVRALASAGLGPGACLTGANRLLAADNAAGLRVGLAMGVVTLRNRRFVFAGAGVPAPFLARRLGDVVDLPVAENPPLGLDAGLTVAETAFDLPVPSTLVLCGSGLLDGTNRFDVPFGRTHMGEVLGGLDDLSADSTVSAVQAALFEHAGGRSVPMARDRTCLAVRVRA